MACPPSVKKNRCTCIRWRDVGGAIEHADATFSDFRRADKQAAIAAKNVPLRFSSVMGGKTQSMRTVEVLVIDDIARGATARPHQKDVRRDDRRQALELLEEFGVKEPGLEKVIAACYRALDLITFLTTGEDETRAWEVRRGAAAPEAAGVIHTDLQRGFIRAEVIPYDELVAAGSMEKAKAAGKIRVEGKDYVVREGDILHVRFAV